MLHKEELLNGFVDNKDFKVFKIDNVFDEEHLNTIKHHYQRFEHYYRTVGYAGQRKWGIPYKEISEKLQNIVSVALKEDVVASEVELCIYTPDFGYLPKLPPHFDSHQQDGQRVTMSVLLETNKEWDLIVEGQKYRSDINQGIVFSGTQQIHWREDVSFAPGEYYASIFAHFAYKNKKEFSANQIEIMKYKENYYKEKTGIGQVAVETKGDFSTWGCRESWIKTAKRLFP